MSSEPVLLWEEDGDIVTLTLNRPEAMNALSTPLRVALGEAFGRLKGRESGAVILTGAGDRAFCAGLDLKELGGETSAKADPAAAASGSDTDAVRAMEDCPLPIIGAINGVAITGGFELALACDVLVASSRARFADTHARVGIMPGWGLSQKLSRAIGIYRAKELSLTGNFLPADQAADWGLVNRVVAPEALLPTCRSLAEDMNSCLPEIMLPYKRVIDDGFAVAYGDGRSLERERNRGQSRSLTPERIAERRREVQTRNRSQ